MSNWTESPATSQEDPFARPPRAAGTGLEAGWLVASEVRETPDNDGKSSPRQAPPQRRRLGVALGSSPKRSSSRFWRPPHPLEGTPLLQGVSQSDRKLLRRLFQSHVAPRQWSSASQAQQHLASLFPFWPVRRWHQVCGPHVFLGATGSGKTTLLFKVARQLVASGRSVQTVALGPPDRTRQAAFAAQAAESAVSVAFVHDASELRRVLSRSGPGEAVLFDTPCLIGRAAWLRGALQHPWLQHPHTVLHLCHSLQHSRATQQRALHCAHQLRCDFHALAHVDLATGIAPLLALQMAQPRQLSFANAAPGPQEPPLPFDSQALLRALASDSND